MAKFHAGEAVKLTDRFAQVLMTANRHKKIDWLARRGVVHRANGHEVFISWSDRKTLDAMPNNAVERIGECSK